MVFVRHLTHTPKDTLRPSLQCPDVGLQLKVLWGDLSYAVVSPMWSLGVDALGTATGAQMSCSFFVLIQGLMVSFPLPLTWLKVKVYPLVRALCVIRGFVKWTFVFLTRSTSISLITNIVWQEIIVVGGMRVCYNSTFICIFLLDGLSRLVELYENA